MAFLQSLVDKKEATIVVRDGRRINLDYKQRKAGTLIEYGDVIIRQTQKLNKKTGQLEMVTQEIVPESQNDLQPGDLLKKASGVLTKTSTSSYRRFILQEGDIVYRHLQSGDVVTINRQPSLHRGSLLAATITRKPGNLRTIRMPPTICASFNADKSVGNRRLPPKRRVNSDTV